MVGKDKRTAGDAQPGPADAKPSDGCAKPGHANIEPGVPHIEPVADLTATTLHTIPADHKFYYGRFWSLPDSPDLHL